MNVLIPDRVVLIAAFLLFFAGTGQADTFVRSHINIVKLDTPVEQEASGEGPNAVWLVAGDSLVAILKNTDKNEITIPKPISKNFRVTDPIDWNFYNGKYAVNSGTTSIHRGEVSLPACFAGNICNPLGDFSVKIPRLSDEDMTKVVFRLNGEDISTLFHFDKGLFRVKEFYQKSFYGKIKGSSAIFSWEAGFLKGQVGLLMGHNIIEGKVKGLAPNTQLTFRHPGSALQAPHTITVKPATDGSFRVTGLYDFTYKVSADFIPLGVIPLKFEAGSPASTLTLELTAPNYDYIITEAPEAYLPGGFIFFKPTDWDTRLSGRLTSFVQLSGDTVHFKRHPNGIAMLLPLTKKEDTLVFHGTVGEKSFILKLPNPADGPALYDHFSLFSDKGTYARTKLWGLETGGVLSLKNKSPIYAFLSSISRARAENVRVHLYSEGKTYDVTHHFIWDTDKQLLTSKAENHRNLYNALKNEPGTLAVTFCDDRDNSLCYRIHERIIPGGTDLTIKLASVQQGKFIVLRNLNITGNSIVKTVQTGGSTAYSFYGLPAGTYQALLVDLDLVVYGDAVFNVTTGKNMQTLLPVKGASGVNIDTVTSGRVSRLAQKPLILHQNDFQMLSPSVARPAELWLTGSMGGSFTYYSDGMFALYTEEKRGDESGTFIFKNKQQYSLLPVHYKGGDYPVISELGRDYGSCPPERPLCHNAFVDVKGVRQGVYDGRTPLKLTLPYSFGKSTVSVTTSGNELTELFDINTNQRSITLKKEKIPVFFNAISTGSTIKIAASTKIYYLSLVPGYKDIEVSVVNEQGGRSLVFNGLTARASCVYAEGKVFSRFAQAGNNSLLIFENLPNCTYKVEMVDRERLFHGSVGNLTLGRTQDRLKAVMPVRCTGSNDQFIEDCRPFLPLVQENRLVSPDFGVILPGIYLENYRDISLNEATSGLTLNHYDKGVILFASRNTKGDTSIIISAPEGDAGIPLKIDSIDANLIRTDIMPEGGQEVALEIEGVTSAFVYPGMERLSFRFNLPFTYNAEEVSVKLLRGEENIDITEFFDWNKEKAQFALKNGKEQEFMALFARRQRGLSFIFAPSDMLRHYSITAVIATPAADVMLQIASDTALSKDAGAILIGRHGNNGFDFRLTTTIRSHGTLFSHVPMGTYDVVVYDFRQGLFGSREIRLQNNQDIFTEIQLRKFKK